MKIYYVIFSLVGVLSFFGILTEYRKADQASKEQAQEQSELQEKLRKQSARLVNEKIARERQQRENDREMAIILREGAAKIEALKKRKEEQSRILNRQGIENE